MYIFDLPAGTDGSRIQIRVFVLFIVVEPACVGSGSIQYGSHEALVALVENRISLPSLRICPAATSEAVFIVSITWKSDSPPP
jgi:hypothetical protein